MNNNKALNSIKSSANFNKIAIISGIFSFVVFLILYHNIFGYSRDQFNYIDMIETLISKGCISSDGTLTINNVEIGFQQEVCMLSYLTHDAKSIYAAQGSFSIFLKLIFLSIVTLGTGLSSDLRNRSIPFLLALTIYLLRHFPLHEFTQVRASIAIGFMIVSLGFLIPISPIYTDFIPALWRKQLQPLVFTLILAISISLHYSIALILPLILVTTRIKTKREFIIITSLMATASFLFIGVVYIFILSYLPQFAEQKIYTNNYDDVNIFSVVKILDIISVIVSFRLINFKIPIQVFCLSAMSCALILFYGANLSNLPTVYAFRLSEILMVFNTFLVASLQEKKQLMLIGPIVLAASIKNFAFYFDNSIFTPL